MHPAPPVVIQKFNGDLMEYWLFVGQFEAHVLGKVEITNYFRCCINIVNRMYKLNSVMYRISRIFQMMTKISLNHCLNFLKSVVCL